MKKIIITILQLSIILSLLSSCDSGVGTEKDEQLVLSFHGYASEGIDSLYLSRVVDIDQSTFFRDSKISGAEIILFENNTLIDTLEEYNDRAGVYFLDPNLEFSFTVDYEYKISAKQSGYPEILATTVCPRELDVIRVRNTSRGNDSQVELNPISTNIIDTLLYERGQSFADTSTQMFFGEFNYDYLVENNLLAGYFITADNKNENNWLEDTLETVWEDYPLGVKIFKPKKDYGQDKFMTWSQQLPSSFADFFHKGNHTIELFQTDEAYSNYRISYIEYEQGNSDANLYSNVENGKGIFTLWNKNGAQSKYRVYVKDNEE